MNCKKPLVSVITITYNHEKYIEDTILGVINQKCDFEVEFIISNDKSTDYTDKVIKDILRKIEIPENITIKYFNQDENLGVCNNFIFCVQKAKGKYLAYCEGDDYWTDDNKLKKQIDLLESKEDVSMSTHEAAFTSTLKKNDKTIRRFMSIIVNGIKLYGFLKLFSYLFMFITNSNLFWKQKRTYDFFKRKKLNHLSDFKSNSFYMSFCTIVVRSKFIKDNLDCFKNQGGAHQSSLLLASIYGPIYHFKDIMSVKRDQESSVTKDKKRLKKIKERSMCIGTNEKIIRYQCLRNKALNKYQEEIFDHLISLEKKNIQLMNN